MRLEAYFSSYVAIGSKVETCGDYFLQTFFTKNAVVNSYYSCWVVSLRCSHLHSCIYVSLLVLFGTIKL